MKNWCVLELIGDKRAKIVHLPPNPLTRHEAKRIAKCLMMVKNDRKNLKIRLFAECPVNENGPDVQYAFRRFKELKEYFCIS